MAAAAAAAKSLQLCLILCDPIDGSPLGSSVPEILQARTLEWGAISFSNAWKWEVKVMSLSLARLLATPWNAAYQAPLSMGFSRQEYWSGLPLPSPNKYGTAAAAAAAAKSHKSCPTLCDPIDGSPSGSPVPGILQARTQKWVAISFSNAWKYKVKVKSLSLTLSEPMDCSLPHSSVHGIFQARVLEWGAIALDDNNRADERVPGLLLQIEWLKKSIQLEGKPCMTKSQSCKENRATEGHS